MTRLFSVTLYYHLAFFVISMVMLGTSLGAMLVYCYSSHFPKEKVSELLTKYCLGFAVISTLAILVHVSLPLSAADPISYSLYVLLSCLLLLSAFVCGGICVCLVLTQFSQDVGKLYAADLAGAGLGCFAFILTLGPFDGISEVILVGAIACLAAFCFSQNKKGRLSALASAASVVFLAFAFINAYLVNSGNSGMRVQWMHGAYVGTPLFERWNSLARVTVSGDLNKPTAYHSTGYSKVGPVTPVQVLDIDLDGSARTSIIRYNNDPNTIQFLKNDVVYLAHYVKPNSKVLIIGSGGGRDVIASLAFAQPLVRGVEINPVVLHIVTDKFADFAGHLERLKNVSFVNDEARSYVSRAKQKYDLIQMSLIDTWAATASGAFVLSENSLYTVEAWRDFLKRLEPDGIFTVSRWYRGDPPAEVLRTVSLAASALKQIGVTNPDGHIVLVRSGSKERGAATILISPSGFTDKQIQTINETCKALKFDYILGPGVVPEISFDDVLHHPENLQDSHFNLAAPTDNSPFFFNMIKTDHLFSSKIQWGVDANWQALSIVTVAALLTVYGTVLLTVLPLRIVKTRPNRQAILLAIYFLAIGIGFMFVEISQVQRLIVFLGHPVYGLTCVLFTLLLSTSLGSWFISRAERFATTLTLPLACLVIALSFFGIVTQPLFLAFRQAPELTRILLCTISLALPGFCMGFALPLGMQAATKKGLQNLSPWFWGLNGAGSVLGSVLALCVSIAFGINELFWVGVAAYCFAWIACFFFERPSSEVTK